MPAIVLAVALSAAACSNSKSETTATTRPLSGSTPQTTASRADLERNVPVNEPGVTDTTITVDVIASKTNPLHGKYAEIADGMGAYFAMVNASGGIYGRKLVIGKQRDDVIGLQNRQQVQQALATDNAFATFMATLQFTGADLLQSAGQPTFGWNINTEWGDKNALFGSNAALCVGKTCTGVTYPWLAQQAKATKIAVLAYGVQAASQNCAQGIRASFEEWPTAKVAFYDDKLQFAQADLSAQVAQMKKKGVQMVFTCIDRDETLVLAKEINKQGLHAIQELPNAYDRKFIKKNAKYYEGSYVIPQFTALEWKPQIAEIQKLQKWVAAAHKPMYEITVVGWIAAAQFVLGLELAGPQFTKQKVIDGLNTQTDITLNGLIPRINWTRGHIDPAKHPEVKSKTACANYIVVRDGNFVPTFATAAKPYVCNDQSTPGEIPPSTTRSFVDG
jgi:branched-chain amino acid transport system substrate-binding protein